MNELVFAFQLGCTAAALLVMYRACVVVGHMDRTARGGRTVFVWVCFGLSYIALALAAAGSLLAIWARPAEFGYGVWLLASAGLILFDRRPAAAVKKPADPEATIPMGQVQ